ncbi:DNA internalization-related competence protein ComEC/Rec2 [Paenibacillus harenae]|uniref:DNA internalization-related competence protein ComEC/Rec2 n=1 Tax=Paenibacillus harenae TaxID=306543 RepID=UPI0004005733|nr:DNA internalization-related competence protein ComEC/Rec2 [Paenibacillus harenae]
MGMNRRPLLWFVICWVIGSAAAAGLSSRGVALAAGALALLALAAVLCRQASWPLAAACVAAAALAAGERMWADARNVTALQALLAAAEADGPRAAYAAEAEGTIVSAVEVDGERATFRMAAELVAVEGKEPLQLRERLLVQLRLDAQPEQAAAAAWRRGDRLRVAGELTLPAGATNSGGFDYRRYLSSQRIHWLLKARGTAAVEAAPGPRWTAAALLGRVDAARGWLGARMDLLYPEDQSGYMKGLVLGIREDLDPQQFQQFSRLGLTHILAISGLHVAVFLYALGGLLRLLRMMRERILLVLMLSVPFYVLLSGASPSVIRAGVMAVLGLLASRLGKLKDGLHLLAAAALFMLAADPFLLENVSFQLSFIVTVGLIIGVPPLRRTMPDWRRGKAVLDLAAVTIVAQLVSFPVTIYYFNQFHALSLLANFLLVPFISFVVMPLGAAALVIAIPWASGGKMLASASHYANEWTFALVEQLSKADTFRTIWATPPIWWVAAWLALLGAAFTMLGRRAADRAGDRMEAASVMEETAPIAFEPVPALKPKARTRSGLPMIAVVLLLLLAVACEPDFFDRNAAVEFIDVGQGDSIHIRTPEGKHILIDGGGTLSFRKPGEEWKERSDPFEIGRKLLVPLLMKRGVRHIDLLVISHLDSDHIRGLQAVVETIPVRGILWNGTVKDADDAQKLLSFAVEKGIPLYPAHAGMVRQLDKEAKLTVLWPPGPPDGQVPLLQEQNENSVVMLVQLYQSSFLFSGDINADTEHALIQSLPSAQLAAVPIPVSVMKVAHHGSRFSTGAAWLRYWRPLGAVASVGATNSYGHPHPDVLSRLGKAEVFLWRTDTDGEVGFRVTGEGVFLRANE